jgi:hypothetical protein
MALVAGVVAEQLDARDAAVAQRRPVVDRANFAGRISRPADGFDPGPIPECLRRRARADGYQA